MGFSEAGLERRIRCLSFVEGELSGEKVLRRDAQGELQSKDMEHQGDHNEYHFKEVATPGMQLGPHHPALWNSVSLGWFTREECPVSSQPTALKAAWEWQHQANKRHVGGSQSFNYTSLESECLTFTKTKPGHTSLLRGMPVLHPRNSQL